MMHKRFFVNHYLKPSFLLLFLLAVAVGRAQTDDVVVAGSDDLRFSDQVTLSGKSARGILSSGSHYSSFFFETVALYGEGHFGGGFNFTCLPRRWGGYASLLFLSGYVPVTCGVALRPVVAPSFLDWQLYGGLAMGFGMAGYEVGTRFSANADANGGSFSWWSASFGFIRIVDARFVTLGLSLDLASILSFAIFL